MGKLHVFSLTVLCCLVTSLAFAYPTFTSPTGLVSVPNADVPATGLQIAADWHPLDDGASIPIRAVFAVGKGVEIGALYDPFNNKAPFNQVLGVSAKAHAVTLFSGNLAFGAQFLSEENLSNDSTTFLQGYFAWTSDFTPDDDEGYDSDNNSSLEVTLGANWTQMKLPNGGDKNHAMRAFAGMTFEISKDLMLIGEYQTKSEKVGDINAITSVALRYNINRAFWVQIGSTNAFDLRGNEEHEMFAGLVAAQPFR